MIKSLLVLTFLALNVSFANAEIPQNYSSVEEENVSLERPWRRWRDWRIPTRRNFRRCMRRYSWDRYAFFNCLRCAKRFRFGSRRFRRCMRWRLTNTEAMFLNKGKLPDGQEDLPEMDDVDDTEIELPEMPDQRPREDRRAEMPQQQQQQEAPEEEAPEEEEAPQEEAPEEAPELTLDERAAAIYIRCNADYGVGNKYRICVHKKIRNLCHEFFPRHGNDYFQCIEDHMVEYP